jgi:hypothetical protein
MSLVSGNDHDDTKKNIVVEIPNSLQIADQNQLNMSFYLQRNHCHIREGYLHCCPYN